MEIKKIIAILFIALNFILGIISESKKGIELNYYVSISFVCLLIGIYLLIKTNKN